MNRTTIFGQMREDHRLVLERVTTLETGALDHGAERRGAAPNGKDADLRNVVALLRRQFATHMKAEDDVLFPFLAGSLPHARAVMGPLQAEHAELRSMLHRLEVILTEPETPARDEQIAVQVRDLVDLLRIHIRKEEAVLLSVAERVLGPEEIDALEQRMRSRMPLKPSPGPLLGPMKGMCT